MIFLNNTFLTNKGNPFNGSRYDRGNLKKSDKVDIYKYSIASLSKIYPWTKAIIYFTLDDDCKHREQELIEFINEEFSGTELIVRTNRNETVQDWIDTYELLDDELIWFYCNDDHIFLDNDLKYFQDYIDKFRQHKSKSLCSIFFSHWPEMLRLMATEGRDDDLEGIDAIYTNSNVRVDSIQIITRNLYKEWWVNGWLKTQLDLFLPRADHTKCIYHHKTMKPWSIYLPYREWCRHFDGYGHSRFKVSNNTCPALDIPEGFFENDIKISNQRNVGYTYLDVNNPNYYAHNVNGADYKWTEDQIPLFWKSRISEIQNDSSPVDKELRKNILFDIAYANTYSQPPKIKDRFTKRIFPKILKAYGYES
jgi:hypothetical protein